MSTHLPLNLPLNLSQHMPQHMPQQGPQQAPHNTPPSAGLQRRQGLAWLVSPLVCPLVSPTVWPMLLPALPTLALAATPAPAAQAVLARAQARLDALTALHDSADTLAWRSVQWQRDLRRLAEADATTAATDSAAQTALDTLRSQSLPALAQAHQAHLASTARVQAAVLAHLAALAAALQAGTTQRAAALAQAQTTVAERSQSEQALRQARQAADAAATAAGEAADTAARRLLALQQHVARQAGQLRAAAQDWAGLHGLWSTLQRDGAAAVRNGHLAAGALPALLLPQPTAPWTVATADPAIPRPDGHAVLAALRSADAALQRTQAALWLRVDAGGVVQAALAAAQGCNTPACTAWQQEQTALAAETRALHTALADNGARRDAAWALCAALPAAAQARLQDSRSQQLALRPALASAAAAGSLAAQAAVATAAATAEQLRALVQQADADFRAAWRAVHGSDPPAPTQHLAASASMPSMSAGAEGPSPLLDRHALHRLFERDDEPSGFGAYTYVLVGTGASQASQGVRQRLARLLLSLRHLPAPGDVPADRRLHANLFVVPSPADAEQQPGLAYDLRLGQSLLAHLPLGLRLAPAARRALSVANGPFLVTLPGRMAAAAPGWPLLFADLSSLPEAVVADVVKSYMGDLLGQFNPANSSWQPPAMQRVALTLVRLVHGTGDLVQAVFPAAPMLR